MLRYIINRRLDAAERDLGASLDYLRHIVRVSLGAFFKFAKIMPLACYRKTLPPEPYHVARMVATREADCGTCLQIEVNIARKAGVSREILRAVLDGRPQDLPEDLAATYRFSDAVVRASGEEDPLRERLRSRYGDKAMVDLALAIATSQVFPLTKRALGYAKSCSLVHVEV